MGLTPDNSETDRWMAEASSNGTITRDTKESSKITKCTGKESCTTLTGKLRREFGNLERTRQ